MLRQGAVISDQQATTRRRLTADYYPLLARAVATLSPDTAEQRASLYDRVRQTLLQQLRASDPPFSGAEIAAELWVLEQAIEQIEGKPNPPAQPQRARTSPQAQPARQPQPAQPVQQAHQPAPSGKVLPPVAVRSSPRSRAFRVIGFLAGIGLLLFPFSMVAPFLGYVGGFAFAPERIIAAVALVLLVLTGPLFVLLTFLRRRRRLRDAGLLKHRIKQFAWRRYDETVRREIARTLDDRALMWAHFLPDHKPEAKTVAADELIRRGYTQHYIESWQPDPVELTVPPAPEKKMSPRWYTTLSRQKATWFKLMYGAVVLTILALVGLGIYEAVTAPNVAKPPPPRVPGSPNPPPEGPAFIVAVAFVIFGIVSIWATGFLYRNRAARILLLRPFGEKRMTRALKRFVTRSIGISGYVYTLSDRNYRPSIILTILVHIPVQGFDTIATLILGPLLRTSPRIASIRNERKYRKLQKIMLRKFRPSSWSFICGGQAFNIRTTDPWWQMCIHTLMHSCEVIVVDLSKVKEGTAWELNQLHAKGILNKCVFVVGEKNVGDVEPVLQRYFPGGTRPTVYVYSDKGKLADKPAYDARFGQILATGLAGWGR